MLKQVRGLVEAREERKGKRGLHWPDASLSRWLSTGSEETEALPPSGPLQSQEEEDDDCDDDHSQWKNTLISPSSKGWASVTKARENTNRENENREDINTTNNCTGLRNQDQGNTGFLLRCRGWVADFLDYVTYSDHVTYAFKFTLGIMLITWPAFVPRWTLWYENARAGMFSKDPIYPEQVLTFFESGLLSSSPSCSKMP